MTASAPSYGESKEQFNMGIRAYESGVARNCNPHRPMNYQWHQWRNGWDAAEIKSIRQKLSTAPITESEAGDGPGGD